MQILGRLVRFLGELALAILGPVALVVAGVLIAGLDVYLEWQWAIYGGVIVGAIGVLVIIRLWDWPA